MEQPTHITVNGLVHVYTSPAGPLTALENVDLEVGRGTFVSVIGPSGGGKTTLLRAIGGLLDPTAGHVEIDGLPPSDAQRRKALGFVFQQQTDGANPNAVRGTDDFYGWNFDLLAEQMDNPGVTESYDDRVRRGWEVIDDWPLWLSGINAY